MPLTDRPSAAKRPSTTWKRVRQRNEPSALTAVPRGAGLLSAVVVSAKSQGAPTNDRVVSDFPSSTTTRRATQVESHGASTRAW